MVVQEGAGRLAGRHDVVAEAGTGRSGVAAGRLVRDGAARGLGVVEEVLRRI